MIAIGSDHGGFELKEKLMEHLSERGLEYKDFGTYSSASCDYPVYAKAVANAVASGECDRGIHNREQGPRHQSCPVRGLLLRRGDAAAQRRERALHGRESRRRGAGAQDSRHLP